MRWVDEITMSMWQYRFSKTLFQKNVQRKGNHVCCHVCRMGDDRKIKLLILWEWKDYVT